MKTELIKSTPKVLWLALLITISLLLLYFVKGLAFQDKALAECQIKPISNSLINIGFLHEIQEPTQNWIRNPNNGHFYKLTELGTWDNAELQAVELGGHLVTINDSFENSWLISTFGTETLWIGYTDKFSEGNWTWINGEYSSYTNWFQHICGDWEPNNAGPGEDYAAISYNGYSDRRCCGGDCCSSEGCIPGCVIAPCKSVEPGPEFGPGEWNDLPDSVAVNGIVEKVCSPLNVTPYYQYDTTWGNSIYDTTPYTITKKGCALTSLSMALNYKGITNNPGTLNSFMNSHQGYSSGGNVRWAETVNQISNNNQSFWFIKSDSVDVLDNLLCQGYPVIVAVKGGLHFVLVHPGIKGSLVV